MNYFLAPALVQLRDEANRQFPNRDKASDGWIGDPSHAARVSDHNPCWTCRGGLYGVVRAIDIDISPDGRADADLRSMLLKATVGDDRVWYVISNGIIYSRTYEFAARQYTGSNGHFAHVHVSLRHGVGEFDTADWFKRRKRQPMRTIDLSIVKEQMLRANGTRKGPVEFRHAVRFLQMALNRRYNPNIKVDGYAGDATLRAWGLHERRTDGAGRPRIPDEASLAALVEPLARFRMKP